MREGNSGIYYGADHKLGYELTMLRKTVQHSWYRDPYLYAIWREADLPRKSLTRGSFRRAPTTTASGDEGSLGRPCCGPTYLTTTCRTAVGCTPPARHRLPLCSTMVKVTGGGRQAVAGFS